MVLGNLQTETDLTGENLRSPTPAINTAPMQITKAAVEGRKVTVFDIGQAFLNSYLRKDGDEIIVELKMYEYRLMSHIVDSNERMGRCW